MPGASSHIKLCFDVNFEVALAGINFLSDFIFKTDRDSSIQLVLGRYLVFWELQVLEERLVFQLG